MRYIFTSGTSQQGAVASCLVFYVRLVYTEDAYTKTLQKIFDFARCVERACFVTGKQNSLFHNYSEKVSQEKYETRLTFTYSRYFSDARKSTQGFYNQAVSSMILKLFWCNYLLFTRLNRMFGLLSLISFFFIDKVINRWYSEQCALAYNGNLVQDINE